MVDELNQSLEGAIDESPAPSGEETPDYRAEFAPELKTALEKFPDVGKLAEGYVALEKDASRLRNEKAGVVDVPETPEGYEIVKPDLPEGMTYNEERTKKFAEIAHSKGISKSAFQAIVNAYNEEQKAEFEAQTQDAQKFLDETTVVIKKEWGKDYETNLVQADAAIERIFGAEFKEVLKNTGLANHPDVVRGMFKASQAIGEHALTVGKGAPSGEDYTMEKLISMKMDPRYSDPGQRDPAFIKEVEAYNTNYAEQMGANS